jgi:hypothetical protein
MDDDDDDDEKEDKPVWPNGLWATSQVCEISKYRFAHNTYRGFLENGSYRRLRQFRRAY